jgi:cell division protein FtsI (penicillin-binding protein 3)
LQTGDQAFHATLQAFGFGSTWETGLPGGIAGRLVAPDSWSGRTKATISFGQELGVTALQMAAAATAFATGGDVMQPHIIKEIKRHDGTSVEKSGARVARSDVISPEVARIVLEGMEMATTSGGTATKAAVDGVRVAAKTGTAQMADPSTGSYRSDAFLASTLALVPADDPEYIIYIGVENPTGATIWGSNIAAPAIGSIIADMVRQGKIRSSAMETVTLP